MITGGRRIRTDILPRRSVSDSVQQPHEAARVPDRLAEPQHGLLRAFTLVLVQQGVLGQAVALVGGADGEDEEDGEGGARDEGEHVRVGEGVDVVDLEGRGEAELVEEGGHELRVGFEGDEGRGCGGGVGVCGGHCGGLLFLLSYSALVVWFECWFVTCG